MEKPTGLVLTGGGLRGVCAQAGALQALEELGYHFDVVIGSSAGAIVGALYASGLTAAEVVERLRAVRRSDYLDPLSRFELLLGVTRNLRGVTGYYRGRALRRWLAEQLPVERIERCPRPLLLAVTNVSRRLPQVKSAGPLAAFARASSAVPVVFAVERVDGEDYADGGVADNVPLAELARLRPELEQLLVLTALRLDTPQPPPDDRYLARDWTPLRVLGRLVDSLAAAQRLDTFDVPQQVVVLKVDGLDLDLGDTERIGEALDLAYTSTRRRIEAGEIDLSAVPRGGSG